MDMQQQITNLVAAFCEMLATFSPEEIARLYGKKEELLREFAAKRGDQPADAPAPSRHPAHETIRRRFTIWGRVDVYPV